MTLENTARMPKSTACETCNDTHEVFSTGLDRHIPCTRCPTPCADCAGHAGRSSYCAKPRCDCACHHKDASLLTPEYAIWRAEVLGHARRVNIETAKRLEAAADRDYAAASEAQIRFARIRSRSAVESHTVAYWAGRIANLRIAADAQRIGADAELDRATAVDIQFEALLGHRPAASHNQLRTAFQIAAHE